MSWAPRGEHHLRFHVVSLALNEEELLQNGKQLVKTLSIIFSTTIWRLCHG